MHEEIIALVPVLLVLSSGLGFGALTALAMSLGSAVVGSSFGPTNPFMTGIGLRFAGLPPLTMPGLRFGLFGAAVVVWIIWTLVMTSRGDVRPEVSTVAAEPATVRDLVLLAILIVPFGPYIFGVLRYDWGFDELTGLFLVAGFAVGLVSGRDLNATARGFLKGMESMLSAALFIGLARAITIVLTGGHIIDTILYGLATPLASVSGPLAALLMIPMHALLHIPVLSDTGHAVLAMPIMAPLADLLSISRDAAVIAYQTGAGFMDGLAPTNGALLAMLLAARVDYGRWVRFAAPGMLLVAAVGAIGVLIAL